MIRPIPKLGEVGYTTVEDFEYVTSVDELMRRSCSCEVRRFPEEPLFGAKTARLSTVRRFGQWCKKNGLNRSGLSAVLSKVFDPSQKGCKKYDAVSGWVDTSELEEGFDALERRAEEEIGFGQRAKALSGVYKLASSDDPAGEGDILISPCLDLEIAPASIARLGSDLDYAARLLAEAGFTGQLFFSGGSFHYYSYVLMPYAPNYWQFFGASLELLVSPHASRYGHGYVDVARDLGSELRRAKDSATASLISQEILRVFPSGERFEDLFVDPRWCGHRANAEDNDSNPDGLCANFLRITSGKGYPPYMQPFQVAEIW